MGKIKNAQILKAAWKKGAWIMPLHVKMTDDMRRDLPGFGESLRRLLLSPNAGDQARVSPSLQDRRTEVRRRNRKETSGIGDSHTRVAGMTCRPSVLDHKFVGSIEEAASPKNGCHPERSEGPLASADQRSLAALGMTSGGIKRQVQITRTSNRDTGEIAVPHFAVVVFARPGLPATRRAPASWCVPDRKDYFMTLTLADANRVIAGAIEKANQIAPR